MMATADNTRTSAGVTKMTASAGATVITRTGVDGTRTITRVSGDAISGAIGHAVLKTIEEIRSARGIIVGVEIPSARDIEVGVGMRRGGIGGSMMMIGSGDIDLFIQSCRSRCIQAILTYFLL
jgi:hypothetical protein